MWSVQFSADRAKLNPLVIPIDRTLANWNITTPATQATSSQVNFSQVRVPATQAKTLHLFQNNSRGK